MSSVTTYEKQTSRYDLQPEQANDAVIKMRISESRNGYSMKGDILIIESLLALLEQLV